MLAVASGNEFQSFIVRKIRKFVTVLAHMYGVEGFAI